MKYKPCFDYILEKLRAIDSSITVRFMYNQKEYDDIFSQIRIRNIIRSGHVRMVEFDIYIYATDLTELFEYIENLDNVAYNENTVYETTEGSIIIYEFASILDEDVSEEDIRQIPTKDGIEKMYYLYKYPFYIKFQETRNE